jgi:hypothetical protein
MLICLFLIKGKDYLGRLRSIIKLVSANDSSLLTPRLENYPLSLYLPRTATL